LYRRWVIGDNVDNSCFIGNIFTSTSPNGIAVLINSSGRLGTITSSARYKDKIQPMDKASEALFALKPVTFQYKKEIDPAAKSQFGLVAEEVEKVNPDLVVRDKEGKPYSVRYDQVNAMLLNEFLKAHRRMDEQDKRIEELTAQLKQQAAQIQKVSAQLAAASPSGGGLEARIPAPQIVTNP
jgi:Chaperone of endosialidase